jgi:hypothetical protein
MEYVAGTTAVANLASRFMSAIHGPRTGSERGTAATLATTAMTLTRRARSTEAERQERHVTATEEQTVVRRRVRRAGTMTFGCKSRCYWRRRKRQEAASRTEAEPSDSSGTPPPKEFNGTCLPPLESDVEVRRRRRLKRRHRRRKDGQKRRRHSADDTTLQV